MKKTLFLHLTIISLVYSQMATIPGGTFDMGSVTGNQDELPLHRVSITAFSIDKTETTFAQYDSCVRSGVCSQAHYDDGDCVIWTSSGFKNVRVPIALRNPLYPVVCVSWAQAQRYCSYKHKKLPTEAQWEYAALANRPVAYSWGNQVPSSLLCQQSPPANRPEKVGSFHPNPWGIYDMTGNVWEWVSDHYSPDYYSVSKEQDPPGAEVGQYRVIRGGGWYSSKDQLLIKNRHWFEPNFSEVSIGFRCVR